MSKKVSRFALLLGVLMLVLACQAPAATGDVTALEARIAALEEKVTGATGAASAGDVAALTNRLTVLEAQTSGDGGMGMDHGGGEMEHGAEMEHGSGESESMEEMPAMVAGQDSLFAITTAAYLMDTAGFHGMDDAINGEEVIDESYATSVTRVIGVLRATPWTPELAEQATTLQTTLTEFATVLTSGDVEAAKPLATRAHEEQHALSHDIAAWANAQMGIESGEEHSH